MKMKTKTIRRLALVMIALSLAAAVFTGCGKSEEGAPTSNASVTKTEASASPTLEQQKSAPGEQELRNGLAACDNNDYEAAAQFFRAAAEQGNSDAMLMLFFCYCEGLGVERQEEGLGDKYLKPAAEAGNEIAMASYASYIRCFPLSMTRRSHRSRQ